MIKKIIKRVLLATSVIVSGTLGFMFTGGKGEVTHNPDLVLQEPIFSIQKAIATDACGDCCCGCGDSYVGEPAPPPTPTTSWVNLYIDAI